MALAAAPLAAQPASDLARFGVGEPNRGLARVPLHITTRTGTHRYTVEVARTAEQQAIGMMHRRSVPPGTGMLFPFSPPRPASFWMRNTLVPLDIIFIRTDGRVLNIEAEAVPLSETMRSSTGPAAAVLELAGGEAKRIGLAPGDRVEWSHAVAGGPAQR